MTLAMAIIATDRCTAEDIQGHLYRCDQRFQPPLSARLEIPAYARKIRHKAHTFEAWQGDALIGLVAAYMNEEDRTCHITSVSVVNEFCGQGIAGQLLDICLKHAAACRLCSASLEVCERSRAALHLYQKYGFHAVKSRDGTLWMERTDLAAWQAQPEVIKDGGTMKPRNFDEEFGDNDRKYAYDFDQNLRQYILRTLIPQIVPGNALEIGCFEGEFTKLLLNIFDDLTVIEASQELADRLRRATAGGVKVLCARIEDASPGTAFDNIFLVHTLEHFDDPVAGLARIRSFLSPGGRLFVVVPNAHAASRQIAVKMGLITHNAAVTEAEFRHGHRITYAFDTLERDARLAGLRIEARGGIFFKPLANFQFDMAMSSGLATPEYLEGCYQLGFQYPDLCASIFLVCSAG
ncbi:MAG: GNAT family N-acetyltransferase [Rhodocyclaceae bacterium]|nr:GNAT family N-acetyltransferase [Rhodocyclaceae bacterium]